jgi:hypothetical protein
MSDVRNPTAPHTHLSCPRCGLTIATRGRWPAVKHCPRCLVRARASVELQPSQAFAFSPPSPNPRRPVARSPHPG